MKNLFKRLIMLCFMVLLGMMTNTLNVSAATANSSTNISVGENTYYPTLSVRTESSWNVTVNGNFITALNPYGSAGNVQVVLRIDSNTSTSPRSGSVTVTDSRGPVTFYITQAGKPQPVAPVTPYVTLTKTNLTVENNLHNFIKVDSNVSWTASSNVTWMRVGKSTDGKYISINCDKYLGTSQSRSGKITISYNNTVYGTLYVCQTHEYVDAPSIEVGVYRWGKYESSLMKTLTGGRAYYNPQKKRYESYISYNDIIDVTSAPVVCLNHSTNTHQTTSTKYVHISNPSPYADGRCTLQYANRPGCESDKKHKFLLGFMKYGNYTNTYWNEQPEIEINTTCYRSDILDDVDLTYIIRFNKVVLRKGPAQYYGVPFNVIYPYGIDGNTRPPVNSNETGVSARANCYICAASFNDYMNGNAQDALKNHLREVHHLNVY